MKKIDKSLLFMLLVFGIYGVVGVLSSESVTAVLVPCAMASISKRTTVRKSFLPNCG